MAPLKANVTRKQKSMGCLLTCHLTRVPRPLPTTGTMQVIRPHPAPYGNHMDLSIINPKTYRLLETAEVCKELFKIGRKVSGYGSQGEACNKESGM